MLSLIIDSFAGGRTSEGNRLRDCKRSANAGPAEPSALPHHPAFCSTKYLLMRHVYVLQKLMAIITDEPKRLLNLKAHGFDFDDFADHFDATDAVFVETAPSRTGRERFLVIGLWSDGRIVTAIVSPLGSEAWSLVSLRTASAKERLVYAQHNPPV